MKKSTLFNELFLLDANISRILVKKLADSFGFDVLHIGSVLSLNSPDAEIVSHAIKAKRCIITHDLDYGEIHFLRHQGIFGVIILRIKDQTSENTYKKLVSFFTDAQFSNTDFSKSLVIITEEKIRVISD